MLAFGSIGSLFGPILGAVTFTIVDEILHTPTWSCPPHRPRSPAPEVLEKERERLLEMEAKAMAAERALGGPSETEAEATANEDPSRSPLPPPTHSDVP